MTPRDSLLETLLTAPDDGEAYLVYADHLQSEGDPQGELIALQQHLAAHPGDAMAGAAESALLVREAERLTGGLLGRPGVRLRWRRGFIETAHLRCKSYAELGPLLRSLLPLPTARLLRGLTTLCAEETEHDYPTALRRVFEQRRPPLLSAPLFGRCFDDLAAAEDAGEPERVLRLRLEHVTFERALPALLRCSNLEELDVSFSTSRRVPAELATLTQLRVLDVAFCYALHDIASEVLALETLEAVSFYDCPLPEAFHMGRLNELLTGFARQGTTAAQRRLEIDLLLERATERPDPVLDDPTLDTKASSSDPAMR